MGKFDGVLIASDFDNTMVYTEGALRSGGPVPAISRENRDAIEYFMAQGGTFSVATGRALPSFASVMDGVPMNGPTVLFNGIIFRHLRSVYQCFNSIWIFSYPFNCLFVKFFQLFFGTF